MSSCKMLFLAFIIHIAVHRFSPFVKVGAESYVLGHAVKKAPCIAEAEKIRIVVSSDQLAITHVVVCGLEFTVFVL